MKSSKCLHSQAFDDNVFIGTKVTIALIRPSVFESVFFRGQVRLEPRQDWSLLGI